MKRVGKNVAIGGGKIIIGDLLINGTNGNDTIYVDVGHHEMNGFDGNDLLSGGDGNDLINGDDGDDSLYGGDHSDTLNGGNGNDLINGGKGYDTLHGDDGDDSMIGSLGDDILFGGNGNDTLRGQSDDDVLIGDDGNDFLVGGSGNDTLNGGGKVNDHDTLIGGSGADIFDLTRLGQSGYLGNGFAIITDFSHVEGDKVDVIGSSGLYDVIDQANGNAHLTLNGDVLAIIEGGAGSAFSAAFDLI